MGFQDQAAESGAELTSLKKETELLAAGSAGSGLDLVGLTKPIEKEKEEGFGYGYEPASYAVQGALPESGSGQAGVELQPKRFGGSSMARSVVEEPNGQVFGMPGLKKETALMQAKKQLPDGEVQLSKSGGAMEPVVYEKKLLPEQPTLNKKLAADESTYFQQTGSGSSGVSAHRTFNEDPAERKQALKSNDLLANFTQPQAGGDFTFEKARIEPGSAAQMGSELKSKSGSEGSSFVQKTGGGFSSGEFGYSNAINTQLPAAGAEKFAAGGDRFAAGGERFAASTEKITATSGRSNSDTQGFGGGTLATAFHQPTDATASKPGIQTQIPAAAEQIQIPQAKFTSVPQQIVEGGGLKQPAAMTQPAFNFTERKQALTGTELQQSQPTVLKLDQAGLRSEAGLRAEPGTSRVVSLSDTTMPRKQDLTTSTVRGTTLASFDRVLSNDFAPPSVRKLTQGSEIGVQSGSLRSGLTSARTTLAQNAGELPPGFSRTNALAANSQKFTPDVQLRAQADRIAAGAQVKAQAEQPVNTGIKLKGEVAANAVRHQDVVAAAIAKPQDSIAQVKVAQQLDTALQPRFAPLTGKTTQDLVQVLRPQDRIAAARNNGTDLTVLNDRRNAASVIRTGADALTPPVAADRGVRTGNAHIISGDVRTFTGKLNPGTTAGKTTEITSEKVIGARAGDLAAADRKPISSAQMTVLITNLKEGRGEISRTPAFDPLMSVAAKSTADRYVGGEFLLASMIIAAGAARRMPENRADAVSEANASTTRAVKPSAFSQIVDTVSKAFTTGRNSDQQAPLEITKRASTAQQNDSVRYITGVELAVLLAAGGVARLRSDKVEVQNGTQLQSDATAKTAKDASIQGVSSVQNGLPFAPALRVADQINTQNATGRTDKTSRLPAEMVTRGERCIPGAEVAIAAMLMIGGISKKRSEERFPANPNELAEKVGRSFRIDRLIDRRIIPGDAIALVKSFVAREPLPVSGLRSTAAEIVSRGDVIIPPQYKQGAQEQTNATPAFLPQQQRQIQDAAPSTKSKAQPEIIDALPIPAGWVHEPVLEKSADDANEEKLKKVEQDQQEGAGAAASQTLYRPIWIIAPGETFVSIAEDHYGDGSIAWLIADLNVGKFSQSFIEGKRVVEIQSRQRIELPVQGDIEEFRHNRKRHMDAENIVTIVTASQLDMELKHATFRQFLGTLQSKLPVPAIAQLPELDLGTASQPKTLRPAAPFGMTAPQFASIAAAVSLPLILPPVDMLQSADTTSAHVQEIRAAAETARQEEQI